MTPLLSLLYILPIAAAAPLLVRAVRARRKPAVRANRGGMQIAFVLLPSATAPRAEAITKAYARRFPDAPVLSASPGTADDVVSLSVASDEEVTAFATLMSAPVPHREAENHTDYSVERMREGGVALSEHRAHLIVVFPHLDPSTPLAALRTRMRVVTAVLDASGGVGVYWGGTVTHTAGFFLDVASTGDDASFTMLALGVATQRREDVADILTFGLRSFELPDFHITAPLPEAGAALAMAFDLATYVLNRGSALPEGDTVGASDDARHPVTYTRSPLDPSTKVARIQLG